jgi:hypothetical protein
LKEARADMCEAGREAEDRSAERMGQMSRKVVEVSK